MVILIVAFIIGLIVGHILYRRFFMKKQWKHRIITITHITYLGECIKLDYPITFCETY